MKFLSTNEIDTAEWQQLVDSHLSASFFQTPECYHLLSSMSFLEPFLFGVEENGKLKGIITGYIVADANRMVRFFSRRAIVPGGVLLNDGISEAAVKLLLRGAIKILKNKAIYIEIRNLIGYEDYKKVFGAEGFVYQKHLNIKVAVSSGEPVLKKLSKSKRRQYRLACRAGVQWRETDRTEDVIAFYSCLKQLYSQRIGVPLFPLEFFVKAVKSPRIKLLVVTRNGKIIGGILCALQPADTVYEWFVCGSINAGAKTYPSVMATVAGIEYAAANGYKSFDFMGAGSPGKPYGVRDFKLKFGGVMVEDGRFLYICNRLLYYSGVVLIKLYKSFSVLHV